MLVAKSLVSSMRLRRNRRMFPLLFLWWILWTDVKRSLRSDPCEAILAKRSLRSDPCEAILLTMPVLGGDVGRALEEVPVVDDIDVGDDACDDVERRCSRQAL